MNQVQYLQNNSDYHSSSLLRHPSPDLSVVRLFQYLMSRWMRSVWYWCPLVVVQLSTSLPYSALNIFKRLRQTPPSRWSNSPRMHWWYDEIGRINTTIVCALIIAFAQVCVYRRMHPHERSHSFTHSRKMNVSLV